MSGRIAECMACDDLSAGGDALRWGLDHTAETGHMTVTTYPVSDRDTP